MVEFIIPPIINLHEREIKPNEDGRDVLSGKENKAYGIDVSYEIIITCLFNGRIGIH